MEKELNNKDCRLYGSPYCAVLNQKSCAECRISKLGAADQLKAAEDILYIAEALPEDGVEGIMNSESCALCRTKGREGAEPNAAEQYAQMDMGHLHPTAKIGEKLSGNYDRGTAMTVPVTRSKHSPITSSTHLRSSSSKNACMGAAAAPNMSR